MAAPRKIINLISDTVTQPTPAMRKAIASAAVGDDVYGSDPTVNALQKLGAELLGKEAALYVPSGTMSNLIALGVHCRRGDEIILGDKSHIFYYEGGGASAYMGAIYHPLQNASNGTFSIDDLKNAIRGDDPHFPRSSLVCIEDTHNMCGGRVLSRDFVSQVRQVCDDNNLKLHLDGARLANASVAGGISMKDLAAPVDTVSLCLSKGLGAPVGSLLAGSEEFINQAKRLRKSLGGGMRQSGLIAQGGIYALENHIERLSEDHANAKKLAQGLSEVPGVSVDLEEVETNMVFFSLTDEAKLDGTSLCDKLEGKGIHLAGGYRNNTKMRAVTNLHVTEEDIDYTVQSIRELVQ